MSYAEVLKRAQEEGEAGGLALVLVLQACGEAVVGGQGRDPTPTELFAGLLASLEASDQGHACEVAVLLEMVLPMVAKGVVKERFEPIADAIMRVIKVYTAAGEREITETAPALLLCLGHTLSSLGLNDATWSNSRVVRVFNFLMGYFSHKQVKLRLASQEAAVLVLEAQAAARERRGSGKKSQGASPLVHGFCSAVLSAVTAQDTSHSLQLLKFMRKAAPLLPTASALALCNQCLKLPNLGNPTLTRASMHFLSAVVQSPALKCEASGIVGLIKSSIDIQPSANDQAGAVSYSQHIASCFVKCQALDPAAARSLLPQVSTSLARYCESSQSAVHKTACFALHTCFQAVVDQHMITDLSSCLSKQGRSSTDCPLGATLAILESLLEYRFQKAWVYALPLLGRLFLHLRSAAYPILASVLRGLDNLHAALGAAPAAALPGVLPALLEAIGFAVEGIGMKNTLTLLPLRPAGTPNAVGVAHSRGYLLPILREHGGSYPSELHYFHTQVLSVARLCDSLVRGGTCTANEMATQKTRVVQLWQLLSAVCVCPTDISSQFDTLAPLLANALHDQRYGTLLAEVCAGLVVLVAGVKDRAQGGDTKAKADLATIAATTPKFLPLLLSLLERSPALSPAQATAVCSAASALASIAPAAFVSQLFKKVLQKLLVGAASNTAPGTAQAAIFFELVASLVPSLSPECAALAFRAAKPSTSASGKGQQQPAAGLQQLQKKAYRVLLALCQHQPAVIISGEHGLEALEFFAASQAACHVGSRVLRLGCLMKLAAALAGRPESRAGCEMMISEALLCTKDSNRRTREAAYDLLLVLAPGVGGPRELVVMVVAALAAQTAHMRSAAVLGLSRLQYEYAHFRSEAWDAAVVELTPSLVRTVLLLLQEEHREVIKASLGYLRVAVGGADRKLLEPLLPEIVTGVMGLDKDARGKFKAKMRVVLSKLTRKFGFDRIKDLVPERDRKLVTHMQKEAERELRAKAARKEERDAGAGRVAGAGRSRSERFESVLDGEDDDDEEEAPGQKGKGKMKEKGSMREEGVVDLLDGSAIRNMQVMDSDSDDAGMGEADLAVGKDGKLIIPDDDEDEEGTSGGLLGNKRKKGVEADDDDDDDDDEGNGRWASASRGKQQKGAAQSHQQRNKKTKVGHGSHSAEQFKSRKAGGDVKRKGQKLEPYAYIPLDPKALTSKKGAARREALNAYDKVGKGQKKGYKNRYGQDSRAGH
ncbi:unnamed protein product [Chrysoparadoxa australica]